MTLEELRKLVDAFGGDPNRWPDDRRDGAEALLESSADARALVAGAAALDRLLVQATPVAVEPALRQRIGAIPETVRQDRKRSAAGRWRIGLGALLPRFAGMAAALALGFYVGTLNLVPVASPFDNGTQAEVVDMGSYVFGDNIAEEANL